MLTWQRWDYDMECLLLATILTWEKANNSQRRFNHGALLHHVLPMGH